MPLPEATQACGICGAPAIWVWPDGVKRCDRHTECDVSETQPSRIPNTTPRLICVGTGVWIDPRLVHNVCVLKNKDGSAQTLLVQTHGETTWTFETMEMAIKMADHIASLVNDAVGGRND